MILNLQSVKFYLVSIFITHMAAASSPWGTTDLGILKPLSENIQLPLAKGGYGLLQKDSEAQIDITGRLLSIQIEKQKFAFSIKNLQWKKLENANLETLDKKFKIKSQLRKRFLYDTIDWRQVPARSEMVCVEEESWCGDVFDDPSGICRNPRYECRRSELVEHPAYEYCARWIVHAQSYNIEFLDKSDMRLAVFEGKEYQDVKESERDSKKCK